MVEVGINDFNLINVVDGSRSSFFGRLCWREKLGQRRGGRWLGTTRLSTTRLSTGWLSCGFF